MAQMHSELSRANAAAPDATAVLMREGFWRRFLHHPPAVISLVVIVIMALLSLAAPLFAAWVGHDGYTVDLFNQYAAPSDEHLLGTDAAGRDVFVRMLEAGQISLFVGVMSALVASVIGAVIGVVAGYYGGRTDSLLMRITDGVIALPLLPVLIILAALDLTKLGIPADIASDESAGVWRIIIIISLFGWTTVARLVRGATLSLREREFVRAAKALGASDARIIWRHVLPNAISPLVVATTLSIGGIILTESVLSYLGLGIPPQIPSWGGMLTNAQEYASRAPTLAIFPGLAIFVTVIAFNFLGDGLQDALDPRAVRR